MKKTHQNKAIDSIIVMLALMALLYAALVFPTGSAAYAGLIKGALGILGAFIALTIASMFLEARPSKRSRKVFILYAQEDTDFVAKLYNALRITPYAILWDKKEIQVGDNIEAKKERLLEDSSDVIVVISKHSTAPDWSDAPLKQAITMHKRILPVVIDHSELPEPLAEIMFADFRESFDDGYFSLRDALKAKRDTRPAQTPEQATAPEP